MLKKKRVLNVARNRLLIIVLDLLVVLMPVLLLPQVNIYD